jgi:RNA polymerase sigma factor (sigma-70 family)
VKPDHGPEDGDDADVHLARAAHDPAAFTVLVERFSPALHGYLARRAPRAADDLLAEAWLEAFAARRTFDPSRGSARGWLFGVARHVLAGHLRRAGRDARAADPVEVDPWQAVDQRLDAAALAPELRRTLAELPAVERELLLLVCWEQLTPTEAAAVVGVPAGTARSRLHRARGRLRERLTRPHRPAGPHGPVRPRRPKGNGMTQREDILDFPGADALEAAGRVEPPAPQALTRAMAAVRAAAAREAAEGTERQAPPRPVVVPLRRSPFALARRALVTAVAVAAVAAGVAVYGSTGDDGPGRGVPRQEQALTAATFLDRTATVASAGEVSDAPYWKVRKRAAVTGGPKGEKTWAQKAGQEDVPIDYYYPRAMDAVRIVVDGETHTKKGRFGWRLGPKELTTWESLEALPTDPARLLTMMNSSKEYGGQSAFLQAGALLGESPAGPELRAGLYRALGKMQGVKLGGTVEDGAGRSGRELVFAGSVSTDRLVIDPDTGVLLETTSLTTKGTASGETFRVTYLSSGPADKVG